MFNLALFFQYMYCHLTCQTLISMQVTRILLFVYLFYHVYLHYDQVCNYFSYLLQHTTLKFIFHRLFVFNTYNIYSACAHVYNRSNWDQDSISLPKQNNLYPKALSRLIWDFFSFTLCQMYPNTHGNRNELLLSSVLNIEVQNAERTWERIDYHIKLGEIH